VKSLNGYDKNDFAQRLGAKWGVGQKGKNNGVVILVKPKYTNEKGEASIQTGYGLEGVLPDITCKQIVDNEMIPKFAQGDYYAGVSAGIAIVMSITKGEFTAGQYSKRARQQKPYGILVPIIILMVVVFWIRMNRGGTHSVGKSLPFWTSLFLLGSMDAGAAAAGAIFNPVVAASEAEAEEDSADSVAAASAAVAQAGVGEVVTWCSGAMVNW